MSVGIRKNNIIPLDGLRQSGHHGTIVESSNSKTFGSEPINLGATPNSTTDSMQRWQSQQNKKQT